MRVGEAIAYFRANLPDTPPSSCSARIATETLTPVTWAN